jgi:hypothetical protein
MKKIFTYGILLACLLTLCGCSKSIFSSGGTEDESQAADDSTQDEEEKKEMTKQQEDILRSYGLSEEEIARQKENGMDYGTQSFVDTAIIMLNYLEEKYNEKFQVAGGYIPGLFEHEYCIEAEACEGEFAGEKFNVYYGENGCRDGYIVYKKQEEACEVLRELIQEEFPKVQVFASVKGEYGDEITLEMTGEQILHIIDYDYVMLIANPSMTEEELKQIASQIKAFLDVKKIFSGGGVYCVANPVDSNLTEEEVIKLLFPQGDNEKTYIWREYIATFK